MIFLLHCMSPVLALSGGSHDGEFTSAFGGVAEVHGRTASAAFEAYDLKRHWLCTAAMVLMLGLSPIKVLS